MKKLKNFQINKEKLKQVYYPGEELVCTVEFTLEQSLTIKRVQVTVWGGSKVNW